MYMWSWLQPSMFDINDARGARAALWGVAYRAVCKSCVSCSYSRNHVGNLISMCELLIHRKCRRALSVRSIAGCCNRAHRGGNWKAHNQCTITFRQY